MESELQDLLVWCQKCVFQIFWHHAHRTPCGTAKPCNEADRTLSSRPCPSARLVQPSRLPTSTVAVKEEEPATNDDNMGIWRRTRFELVKKKAEREATAIACLIRLEKIDWGL